MSNLINTVKAYCAQTLKTMADGCVLLPYATVDKTSDWYQKPNGYKVGDELDITTTGNFELKEFTDGGTIEDQDIREAKHKFKIEKHFDISVDIGARQMALEFRELSEQVLDPIGNEFAMGIDKYIATKALGAANLVVAGADFTSDITKKEMAAMDKAVISHRINGARSALINPTYREALLGTSWFTDADYRGEDGIRSQKTAFLGTSFGTDWLSSVNFPTLAWSSGVAADLALDAGTGSTVNLIGDNVLVCNLTVANVNVNDRLNVTTSGGITLATQLVVESVSAKDISLVNPITAVIPVGSTISVVLPGQDIVVQGSIWDEKYLAAGFPQLDEAPGAITSSMSDPLTGVSLRVVAQYDRNTKHTGISVDCLAGAVAYDPRHAALLCTHTATV